jgi:hypothetical protein
LGPTPTFTLATASCPDGEKIPMVFSPRFEVNTRSSASDTSAPATPVRSGMERRYVLLVQSITSTASFAVCAT